METNDRIKEVRKDAGLTTREMAERLGVTSGSVSLIETGKRNVTRQIITAICREFKVSENWLLTGEGEKYEPLTRSEAIADLTVKLSKSNDPFYLELAKMLSEMTEEQLSQAKEAITRLYNAIEKE